MKVPRAFNFIHPHMFGKIGTYLLPQVLLQSSLGRQAFKSLLEAWKISSIKNYVSLLPVWATGFDVRAKCKAHVLNWGRKWNWKGPMWHCLLLKRMSPRLLCRACVQSVASVSHWSCTSARSIHKAMKPILLWKEVKSRGQNWGRMCWMEDCHGTKWVTTGHSLLHSPHSLPLASLGTVKLALSWLVPTLPQPCASAFLPAQAFSCNT